jgi:hypothetical protein
MIKSYEDYTSTKPVNESITSIILGLTLAVYALKFFRDLTKGYILKASMPKDVLHKIVYGMIKDATEKRVVNVGAEALLNTNLKAELDTKIETGEIKSAYDIKQFLKNYVDEQTK